MTQEQEYIINGTKVEVGQVYTNADNDRIYIRDIEYDFKKIHGLDLVRCYGYMFDCDGKYNSTLMGGAKDLLKCVGRVVPLEDAKEPQPDADGYVCKCPECGKSFAELGLGRQCTAHKHMYEINAKRADADGWIAWHGGECPVDGDTMVEVKMYAGSIRKTTASKLYWGWYNADEAYVSNIIAYRIVQPAQSEPKQPEICSITGSEIHSKKKLKLSAEYCHKEITEMAKSYARDGITFELAFKNATYNFIQSVKSIENNPELEEYLA